MRQKFSVAWIVLRNGFASGWWEPRVDASQEVVSLENEKFRCAASLHVVKRREKCAADWMKLSWLELEWWMRYTVLAITLRLRDDYFRVAQESRKQLKCREWAQAKSLSWKFPVPFHDRLARLFLSRTQMAVKSFPPPTIARSDETSCLSSGPQRRTIAK